MTKTYLGYFKTRIRVGEAPAETLHLIGSARREPRPPGVSFSRACCWLCVAIVILVVGCDHDAAQPAKSELGKLQVYAVNYPLAYFASRIGGDAVDAKCPVPPKQDPAHWIPDTETVVGYQQADLILLNGAMYAKWIPKVTLPNSRLLNTSKSVKDRYIVIEGGVTHSHGDGQRHTHDGYASTTWLDTELASAQATAIHDALVALRPEDAAAFGQNLRSLNSDLDAVHQQLTAAVSDAGDKAIVYSHPVFQYLDRKYGMNGESVHWRPMTPATEEDWAELARVLEDHPATWMIWEGEPGAETVKRLEELGIRSAVFDTCATQPVHGDWLAVMRRNALELARVYADN